VAAAVQMIRNHFISVELLDPIELVEYRISIRTCMKDCSINRMERIDKEWTLPMWALAPLGSPLAKSNFWGFFKPKS